MCDLESANQQGSGSGIDKNEETPMTGPLENDVINALRRKANSVPDVAIERLSFYSITTPEPPVGSERFGLPLQI